MMTYSYGKANQVMQFFVLRHMGTEIPEQVKLCLTMTSRGKKALSKTVFLLSLVFRPFW